MKGNCSKLDSSVGMIIIKTVAKLMLAQGSTLLKANRKLTEITAKMQIKVNTVCN